MKLVNFWYKKEINLFCWLLYPAEFIYLFIISIRKKLYQYKIFKTCKFNVPVIMVGNLTVGGTGKTPMVIYIANYLKNQGFKPAVVMHGYKSKYINSNQVVNKNVDAALFGDEPVLVASNVDCPVIIGKNRAASVNFLLKNMDVNVIICDDGLQHYSLARDLEIVVIDGMRLFGNGHCLPLGPLRENITRLNTVDLIIFNNRLDAVNENLIDKKLINLNQKNNQYIINLVPTQIYNLLDPKIIKLPAEFSVVHAVSGIGNNQRFFDVLHKLGIKTINHAFEDHYKYREQDLCFNDDLPIIMTEKDAVKCLQFAKNNLWCLKIQVEFNLEQQQFFNNHLINFLKEYKIQHD